MSNLIVRTNGGEQKRPPVDEQPLRWTRWDPFRQMLPFSPGEEQPARFAPDFEVRETKDGYVFKADIPGVREKDLEITMTGNRLSISGKRDVEPGDATDCYYACERSYGAFTRAFTLPEGTDGGNQIKAELRDGVLTLSLPKKPELQPKRIEVKVVDKSKAS